MWFMESIFFIIVLTIITFFAGQPLLLALSRENRFLDAEKFCLSLLYGTFTISYLFGIGSYCNLPGKYIGPIILFIICASTFFLRNKLRYKITTKRNLVEFLLVCLAAIIISLMPILVYDSFSIYNDTIGYISISDYLYNHGFLKKYIVNIFQPLDSLILLVQPLRARVAGSFFMTAVQSIFGSKNSIFIFPVVQTFGMILTLASVVVAARWMFRLRWKYILITLILVVITFNPIYYSIHNGFYHQIYGWSYLLVTLASFSRLIQTSTSQNYKRFFLINAIFLSSLLLIYPELFPFAFLSLSLSALMPFVRKKTNKKRWMLLLCGQVVVILLITNIGFIGVFKFLQGQSSCIVGCNITYSTFEFLKTALGIMPIQSSDLVMNIIGILFFSLFIFAVYNLIKTNYVRYFTWLSSILVFFVVFVYFMFFVNNPWIPGAKGQTWNLFKIVNWIYPILIVGIGYAISQLRWKKITTAFVLTACIWIAIISHPYYYHQAVYVNMYTKSDHPFTAYKQFAAAVKNINSHRPIELLCSNNNKILAYFLNPIPVIADWRDDLYLRNLKYTQINERHYIILPTPDVITDKARALPANTSLIDSTMPHVTNFKNFYDSESSPETSWRWTSGDVVIKFNYDKDGQAKINFKIKFITIPAAAKIAVSNNKPSEIYVNKDEWVPIELLVKIKKGTNTFSISSNIKPIKVPPDTRPLAFAISNLKIAPK